MKEFVFKQINIDNNLDIFSDLLFNRGYACAMIVHTQTMQSTLTTALDGST